MTRGVLVRAHGGPEVLEWAEVELYRERGEWGSYLLEGSGVRIIVGYDHERFVGTLLKR